MFRLKKVICNKIIHKLQKWVYGAVRACMHTYIQCYINGSQTFSIGTCLSQVSHSKKHFEKQCATYLFKNKM